MNVCVLGLGYIGMPTACLLAASGNNVFGVDISEDRVKSVNDGTFRLNEKGFETLYQKARKGLGTGTAPKKSDAFIIAVPTPFTGEKKADLSYVDSALSSISGVLEKGNLVILESTVPPGTTRGMGETLKKKTGMEPDRDFFLAHCPERAFPGNLIHELVNNDRIIGSDTEKGKELARKLYSTFCRGRLFLTDSATAEFVKLIENTYRGVNIALANELAILCEKIGINVFEAIELANRHPRVNIHQPGAGVGGHCIPIDPWFLVGDGPGLIKKSLEINESMPDHMAGLLEKALKKAGKPVKGSRIVILGASYKPDVDDARETPTLPLARKLESLGADVTVHDPFVKKFKYKITDSIGVTRDSDAVMIVTPHSKYTGLDWKKITSGMRTPVIIDGRNLVKSPPEGSIYFGIGKG